MAGVTDTLFRRVIRGLGGCGPAAKSFVFKNNVARKGLPKYVPAGLETGGFSPELL
jgi:hypothetical protein